MNRDIVGNVRKGNPAHAVWPVAIAVVTRMDALFAIERDISGIDARARLEARQRLSRPLLDYLHDWLLGERSQMSRHNPVARAIISMFEKEGRWKAFTRFLDDGRVRPINSAAERALRDLALGRKTWLFAGSERGGDRAGRTCRSPPARTAPVELSGRAEPTAGTSPEGLTTVFFTIAPVAKRIGENLGHLKQVAMNE